MKEPVFLYISCVKFKIKNFNFPAKFILIIFDARDLLIPLIYLSKANFARLKSVEALDFIKIPGWKRLNREIFTGGNF